MDVSVPKPSSRPIEQAPSSLRSLSGWLVLHSGSTIAWGCARHKDTAQSSCQAEVHSINETTKLILEFRLLFRVINPGKLNLADLFTKEFRDVNLFLSLRNLFMIVANIFSSGGIPVPLVDKPTYKDALTNPP